MKPLSFRWRLLLLSVCGSALGLASFAMPAWALVRRVSLGRVDRQMVETLQPHLDRPPREDTWTGLLRALDLVYGTGPDGGCQLLVKGPEGQVVDRSAGWPSSIAASLFRTPSPQDPALRRPPPPLGPPRPVPPGRGPPPRLVTPPEFSTVRASGRRWRLCSLSNGQVTLALAFRLDRFAADLGRVRNGFLISLSAALLLIAGLSWLLADRALRPVARLTAAAEQVTASSLDRRLSPADAEAEFARLIAVFNAMLDRLQRSFQQAVRFSADAAHELRTPLTVLQGELAEALHAAPAGSEQQQLCAGLLEEVGRLKAIVHKLLLLSQADSGQLRPARQPFDLSAAVRAVAEDAEAAASDLTVTAEVAPDVVVLADGDLLGQAISNLISNAAKYNRPDGRIELTLRTAAVRAEVRVVNTGPGIPVDDRARVFERFYRADPARGRRVDGTGLGLSLAREIARAHGGDLVLADGDGERTTFVLTMPLHEQATGDR